MFPRTASYDSSKVSLTTTSYQDLWCGDSNGGGIKLSTESHLWYNLRLVSFPPLPRPLRELLIKGIMSVSDEHNRASFAMGAFIFMQTHNMQIDTSCFHASSDPIRRFGPSGRKPDFALGASENS